MATPKRVGLREGKQLAADAVGLLGYRSANPFELYHVLHAMDAAAEQPMFGWLLLPEKPAREPLPAVVCCHGSSGWRGHHHEHMVRWLAMGVAVFRVHSFEARRVASVVEDQMAVTSAMMLADAYGALALLAAHSRIDGARVAIAGWSLGGSAALYAAWEPVREALAPSLRFAAHLPFYPAAHVRPEEARWSPSPIRVLHGGADDYTPAHHVVALAEEMRGAGARIEARIYEGGHHAFDSIEPVTFLPEALRVGKRPTQIGRDGRSFVLGSDGTRHALDEPAQRAATFAAAGKRGAHVGGSWDVRRRAFADAEEFLSATLLG